MTHLKKVEGLTPKEIVSELDRFIIGQNEAKKAVAIALRNRYRRKLIDSPLKEEIIPKNILMIGPTGVGKTEISKRLAKLTRSPFIKVEATKFTEVGYVGREVESIVRDLVDIAICMLKTTAKEETKALAKIRALEIVLDALVGKTASAETRNSFRQKILNGELDNNEIEIVLQDNKPSLGGSFDIPGFPGAAMGILNIGDMLSKTFNNKRNKTKKMPISDAINALVSEESEKLIDEDKIIKEAIKLVENDGIVFLDEIDKITSRSESSSKNSEVSREGVQRDLLPLIEGTIVTTKYGPVKTDYILFIASGAFHLSKPSDLLPELQGRLPIRVSLNALTQDDMIRVLQEPEGSLIKQYIALMETEGVTLRFLDDGVQEIADAATSLNTDVENIGARRLHTIMEKLLEDVSFNASEMKQAEVVVDKAFVRSQLSSLTKGGDLNKFIL